MNHKTILISGAAGFIGFHLSMLLSKNFKVIGIDNFIKNYDVKLKKDRLKILKKKKNFLFINCDISNYLKLKSILRIHKPTSVINLAAVPGVRNSIKHPKIYLRNNVIGFFNIYILSLKYNAKLFIYGSSSSVYGNTAEKTDYPISFYAATKKVNEIFAHSFSNFSKMKTVGLRFFTVYGPWGRPDMAIYKFVDKIYKNQTIKLYNYGRHSRDFSYIDDVVKSISLIIKNTNKLKVYNIFDIGKGKIDKLEDLLKILTQKINKKIKIEKIKMQDGDVLSTRANIKNFYKLFNFKPNISLKTGISNFVDWYKKYKNI